MATDGTSKTGFVEDYLRKNPDANEKAVNEAWREAGHEGSISGTLIYNVKGRLSGKSSAGGEAKRAAPMPKAKSSPARSEQARPAVARSSRRALKGTEDLEAEFDRLLFKLMDRGMPEVEERVREARRMVILGQG
ncbi:hypothetical protein [Tautonia plasticadhaerens]|uniref:Uncharacterized protein n=1 Tax=Tautonia plasticadhaerens TaxID=2527974 RepID=A0A518H6D1_9BACT|nr:hypothetical protein [Tautonia plasticadhaerens]QDV36385.1 hypothetical protein ElP_43080 [Tautonia plasticadhaerens]